MIPGIIIYLQKMWRGYLAREHYKRLKAAHKIKGAYRLYKLRSYVTEVQRILGFPTHSSNRGKGRNSQNNQMVQVPSCGLNVRWPKPPPALRRVVGVIQAAYGRWWAYRILQQIPEQDWPQLRLKVFCHTELMKGRRRNWGIGRDWKKDYLSAEGLNSARDYQASLNKIGKGKNVAFSSRIIKATPGGSGKFAERSTVLTDDLLYK